MLQLLKESWLASMAIEIGPFSAIIWASLSSSWGTNGGLIEIAKADKLK